MTAMKSPTGADLPDTFIDRYRRDVSPWSLSLAKLVQGSSWPSTDDVTEHVPAYRAYCRASHTVALHVREGISPDVQLAGIVIGGTATEAASPQTVLVGSGELMLLDAWRVTPNGEHIRIAELDSRHVNRLLTAEIKLLGDVSDWRLAATPYVAEPMSGSGATPEGILGAEDFDHELSARPGRDPVAQPGQTMKAMARAMRDVPAAVSVPRPEVPELTGSSLEDAKRLFSLTAGQLAEIFGVTERQMRRYLSDGGLPPNRQSLADGLAAIGLTVVPGLGSRGAREWLYSGAPPGHELARDGRIAELSDRADALRDSPFT